VSTDELSEARREARVEAIVFVLVAAGLLIALAVASLAAGWELLGAGGWLWLGLCVPEALVVPVLLLSARVDDAVRGHRLVQVSLALVVLGNAGGLAVLVGGLLTEPSSALSGAQLLASGAVVWMTNVIVFGLWFWTLDCGGPIRRATQGRARPDFQFPQDENPSLAREGWYPRLEDYVYVSLTNGIAFSPTDAMPLTRWAKALMGVASGISGISVLLVAARAINILGS
jgi:hypothetical protein